jgi:hypothetical protein
MSAQQAHTIGKLNAGRYDGSLTFEHLKTAADGAAGDATSEVPVGMAMRASKLFRAYFIPAANLTAHDTNFATLIVSKRAAGGGSKTTIASIATTTTGSGNFVAWVPVPLTLIADPSITALSQLSFEITKAASGVAVPIGKLVLVLSDAR